MRYDDQPWKKKYDAGQRAATARLKELRSKNTPMSQKPHITTPNPTQEYAYLSICPECGNEILSQFQSGGGWINVCPTCDWWWSAPTPID